jgi:hypothetical protein
MTFTWKKFGLWLKKIFWTHFQKRTPPATKGDHSS